MKIACLIIHFWIISLKLNSSQLFYLAYEDIRLKLAQILNDVATLALMVQIAVMYSI